MSLMRSRIRVCKCGCMPIISWYSTNNATIYSGKFYFLLCENCGHLGSDSSEKEKAIDQWNIEIYKLWPDHLCLKETLECFE